MSVILDALRKLDREKSSLRTGRTNISADILKPDYLHTGKKIPLYMIIMPLTAVATAAITYAVVEFGFSSKSSRPTPLVSSASLPMKASATSQQVISPPIDSPPLSKLPSSLPVNPPEPREKPASTPISHEPAHESRSALPKIEPLTENKPPLTPLVEKEASKESPSEKAEVPPAPTVKPTDQASNESSTIPPQLKLSAIVWYEEASKRFAMVNGMIAYEGTIIEGVKVEEIYSNRVRFSHRGRVFEIALIN